MCTPLQILEMITKPLFTCPVCQSHDVVAIATPASAPVHLWFDARCRACGLCEIELINDVDEEPPIVARWLARPTAPAHVMTAVEWSCPACGSQQLVLGDRAPTCAFCGGEVPARSRTRQWN